MPKVQHNSLEDTHAGQRQAHQGTTFRIRFPLLLMTLEDWIQKHILGGRLQHKACFPLTIGFQRKSTSLKLFSLKIQTPAHRHTTLS